MEVCIKTKGNKAKIFGNISFDDLENLDFALSYRMTGFEYSPAYKAGRWNGYFHTLSKKLEFPIGLLPKVKSFLESSGFKVSIEHLDDYIKYNGSSVSDRLTELGKPPRDYQIRAAKIALEKKRGIIKVCTGGGKTLIAALFASEAGGRIVVYVIGKDLLWQFHEFFEEVFQEEVGMVGDGICNIKKITVASVWTVGQAFGMKKSKTAIDDEANKESKLSKKFYKDIIDMVSEANVSILDECHLGAAETIQKIGAAIKSQYTIGMSASPWRDDGAGILIEGIFGEAIVDVSASELIEKGFLVQPHIRFFPIPRMIGAGNNYRSVYRNYIVENEIRNGIIVKGGNKLVEQGFVTMILYKEIEHGKILHEKFADSGRDGILLSGKMSADVRKNAVQRVLKGECKLVLASSIFDIGVDIPNLSGLVLAGGGKSSIRAIQRIGRVIRPFKGKEIAAVIEFNDNCRYLRDHSKIRKKIYSSEKGFIVEWK